MNKIFLIWFLKIGTYRSKVQRTQSSIKKILFGNIIGKLLKGENKEKS